MFSRLSFTDRAQQCSAIIAKNFFNLMVEKQSNLAFSADVLTSQELLTYADLLGPEIVLLKTHIDIIQDFTPSLITELQKIARKHHFFLFEDRKFADIGNTVKNQYAGGIYHIADWADFINAHALPGPGIIQGLAAIGLQKHRGLLLLAEMSSTGHLMNNDYQQKTLKMAEEFPDFVVGFISQHALSPAPHWITMTPGIHFGTKGDALGQHYITPEQAILQQGSDVIIVGRGILTASDPLAEAKKYRKQGWNCVISRAST